MKGHRMGIGRQVEMGAQTEGGAGGEENGNGEAVLHAGTHAEVADEQRSEQRQREGALVAPQLQHLRGARVSQQHQRAALLLLQQALHHLARHVHRRWEARGHRRGVGAGSDGCEQLRHGDEGEWRVQRGQERHARVGHDTELLLGGPKRLHPVAGARAQARRLGEEAGVVDDEGAAVGEELEAGYGDE